MASQAYNLTYTYNKTTRFSRTKTNYLFYLHYVNYIKRVTVYYHNYESFYKYIKR